MEHARRTAPHLIDLCAPPKGENPALPKAKKPRSCSERAMPRSSAYAKAKRHAAVGRRDGARPQRPGRAYARAARGGGPSACSTSSTPAGGAAPLGVRSTQRSAAPRRAPGRMARQQRIGGRKCPGVSTPSTPRCCANHPTAFGSRPHREERLLQKPHERIQRHGAEYRRQTLERAELSDRRHRRLRKYTSPHPRRIPSAPSARARRATARPMGGASLPPARPPAPRCPRGSAPRRRSAYSLRAQSVKIHRAEPRTLS